MQDIIKFLEDINHEMPDHQSITIERQAYKVDGEHGIKNACNLSNLKSVDYFENHLKRGLLYLEFSDLIKQDEQIKEKVAQIRESNLPKKLNAEIRKHYYKVIHKELVDKFKDSLQITTKMVNFLENIPECFLKNGDYVIIIPPIDFNDKSKAEDIVRFLDVLKSNIRSSLNNQFFNDVKIVPLDVFCK